MRKKAWVEGFAIAAAVFLVASVGSFVDYRKEVEFVKKRTESNKKNVCRVLRNGKIELVHHNDLQVGEVMFIEYGMNIPVDGMVF